MYMYDDVDTQGQNFSIGFSFSCVREDERARGGEGVRGERRGKEKREEEEATSETPKERGEVGLGCE